MIHIYRKNMDEMWFAAAIKDEAIIATTFALNEKEVLEHLLKSLPPNMPFQMAKKPTLFSTKVLSALKSIFAIYVVLSLCLRRLLSVSLPGICWCHILPGDHCACLWRQGGLLHRSFLQIPAGWILYRSTHL